MRDILAAKPEKDFTIIKRYGMRRSVVGIFFITLIVAAGCSPDLSDDPIPPASFPDIFIDLNLPAYTALKTDKGYKYIDGGVKGIILYRFNSTTYFAFERNCSYQPNEACATVNVHTSGLYMIDPCCSSTFEFSDGDPMDGPAWSSLRRYRTTLDGFTLTITDESTS
jgi:hypothetical protein